LDKLNNQVLTNKTSAHPNHQTNIGLLAIIVTIGFLSCLSLIYHFPFTTSLRFETEPPGNMYIFMLPSLLHIGLVATILVVAGYAAQKKYTASSKSYTLYFALSLLVVLFQGWLIHYLAHDQTTRYNWSILMPDRYLEQSVSKEIINAGNNAENSVCGLLMKPDRTTLVSGVNSDGLRFSAYPSRTFALKALNGKIPEKCKQLANFETARTISQFYPSLKWFKQECNEKKPNELCDTTQENLIKYGAPAKITWHQTRFYIAENSHQLEFVAVPDKGVLFVKNLPVKAGTLHTEDIQRLATEADSIRLYSTYLFDCTGGKYAKFSKNFSEDGDQLLNWKEKQEDPAFNPLPQGNTDINGYFALACK
jgi:hypothetical protein